MALLWAACLALLYGSAGPPGAWHREPALSTLSEGLNVKTTLMRTISTALFILRDALSGARARLSDRTLRGVHYGGPGWPADTLHTHTLIIAFLNRSVLLLMPS